MNASPGADKRLNPRFVLDKPAEFLSVSNLAATLTYQVCVLVDISLGGARVRSQVKYDIGKNLNLRASICDHCSKIDLSGKILRVSELPSGWYEYGIAFENLSSRQMRALQNGLECIVRCKRAIA